MPILDVEIVMREGEQLPDGLAGEIADQAGEIFGSSPGGTWVKVRVMPRECYAENGGGPPEGVYPVFVSVLKAGGSTPERTQVEVRRLTQAIARACNRPPENVDILYLPPAAGRIAFGGRLVS